jgi:integrase/recombinase XerD
VLGERELVEIGLMDVLEFRRKMMERRLSVSRQYSLLVVLKLFFRFCRVVLKFETIDPAELKLPKRPYRRVEFLTAPEIQKLICAIPTHTFTGMRLRALVEVLLTTGLRISEALSLNRASIDRQNHEAEIIGKGNRPRTVFFSQGCLAWIDRYLAFRRDTCPALFITTGRVPRRLGRADMSKAFKRLRRLSGITKRLTPHMLRHTFCTSLLHNGADIMFIKELAGHQDIQTTARYYLGVDKASLKAVLTRSQIHGWSQLEPPTLRTPDIVDGPVSQPGGPAPGSSGTWSPGVHVPGFP